MKHSAWQTLMGLLLLLIVCMDVLGSGTLAAVENRRRICGKRNRLW